MRAIDELLTNYQHVIDQFNVITGSGGAFEFKVDGDLVFSKKSKQKRHAEPGELLQLFEEIIGPNVEKYPQPG